MENRVILDTAGRINSAIKHCIQMNAGVIDLFIDRTYGEAVWPMKGYKNGKVKLTLKRKKFDDETSDSIIYNVIEYTSMGRIISTEIGENLTQEQVADIVNFAIWGY